MPNSILVALSLLSAFHLGKTDPKDAVLQVYTGKGELLTDSSNQQRHIFVEAQEGDTLNLTCKVENTHGLLFKVNWYLATSMPNRFETFRSNNSYGVLVPNLTTRDSGPIQCTAESQASHGNGHDYHFKQKLLLRVKPRASGECGPSLFHCSNSLCIPRRYVCDGVEDCTNGIDESFENCGIEPCHAKLRCEDQRCMDPSQCCNPDLDSNCTFVPECCMPLIESTNQFYHRGIDQRSKHDLKILHSTICTVVGSVLAFVALIIVVTCVVCRMHVRRNHMGGPAFARAYNFRRVPPLNLFDVDVYFHSLQQHQGREGSVGITYNINNGVQIVGAAQPQPVPPPPYQEGPPANEPPPPYNVDENENEEGEVNLNAQDDNNNGDINGNGEMVNQNLVPPDPAPVQHQANEEPHRDDAEQQQLLHQPR